MLKTLNTLHKDRLKKVWTTAAWEASAEARRGARREEASKDPKKLGRRIEARHRLMARIDNARAKLGLKPYFKEE